MHCSSLQAKAVSVEDYGKDLEAVQALQRKQEEVERDMTALQAQLEVGTPTLFNAYVMRCIREHSMFL